MGNKETPIQQAIICYLQMLENQGRLIFLRNNSFAGRIQRANGSQGYINNRKPGSPDVLVFLNNGRSLMIEIKAPKGKLNEAQQEFKLRAERLGHDYLIARGIECVEAKLKELNI